MLDIMKKEEPNGEASVGSIQNKDTVPRFVQIKQINSWFEMGGELLFNFPMQLLF